MISYYRDGGLWIAISRPVNASDYVEIGIGETRDEAEGDLGATPIQATGSDRGLDSALTWAEAQGMLTGSLDTLEEAA